MSPYLKRTVTDGPGQTPEAALSNTVAANIADYVDKISFDEGSTLDLSDEGLSVWTDELRDAVLNQLSIMIDTDYPINTLDLSENNFDATEVAKIERDIKNNFNAPEEIKWSASSTSDGY